MREPSFISRHRNLMRKLRTLYVHYMNFPRTVNLGRKTKKDEDIRDRLVVGIHDKE